METVDSDAQLNYLIGQVMKATGGRADPQLVRKILIEMVNQEIEKKKISATVDTQKN